MRKLFVSISIVSMLLLAGCSGAQVEAQNSEQTGISASGTNQDASGIPQEEQYAGEITQLIFGTFKLEGSDLAVTAEQATELLPLWKLYYSLLESDITATAEVEAVAKQISQTMTSAQLAAMEGQDLDREQMNALFEELGIETLRGNGTGEFSLPEGSTPPEGFVPGQGGGPGGGGGLGSGGGPGGGTGIDPEMMSTREAMREESAGFQRGFNLPIVAALIELLEARTEVQIG